MRIHCSSHRFFFTISMVLNITSAAVSFHSTVKYFRHQTDPKLVHLILLEENIFLTDP